MKDSSSPEEVGLFQVVVLVLSIVVLVTLVVDTTLTLPPEISRLLQGIDNFVCVILLIDFGVRFKQAESKPGFMKWGWIDLVASIPTLNFLRLGRVVRVIRVIRVLRTMRLVHQLFTTLFRHRLKSGFASAGLAVFLLLSFSSISILLCERAPKSNITTAEDAIWWSVTTITTVGYGDRYPVTTEGRLVAMVLMISGLGLFGTISGMTATLFIGPRDEASSNQVLAELRALRAEVTALKDARNSPT